MKGQQGRVAHDFVGTAVSRAGPCRLGPRRDRFRRRDRRRSRRRALPLPSHQPDRRRRQPPGRSRHHPFLFPRRPASVSTATKIDEALKALYATGLFQDVRINQSGGRLIVTVVENPVINRVAFEGNKKLKDDQTCQRGAVEAARDAVASDGAGRRAAHRRNLPAQRPLRRPRRAEDHRAAEQPRRSRVRDQRRRQDRRQEDHLRRQQDLRRLAPEGRDQDVGNHAVVRLPADRPTSTIPIASKPTAI